jgi:acetate---CoA ligase (ADP-forming)
MPYPSEYELDIVLRDGVVEQFRPIKTTDAGSLVKFFDRLGTESRYYRFFRAKKLLTAEEVEYFTTIDYEHRMAIAVFHEREMVAVGRYDREADDPKAAEVSFAVADDQQGRGIGTQLLQILTTHGRSHGVERFNAFVLPDNLAMMRVFRNSGYTLTRNFAEGVYSVEFPVQASDSARAAEARREQRAIAASILPMFYPRSIAVVGASRTPGSIGARLFDNIMRGRFSGVVYPVNPNTDVVGSVRAYRSVTDIPYRVDLAIIVAPAAAVLNVVKECAEKGVRGLVIISAGFSEVGPEGAECEAELVELVRSSGMRMIGPNCLGLVNTDPAVNLNATFAPVETPRGNVAMLSQSGALGISLLDYARRHDIGISQFVSVGNKPDVSGNDLMLHWEEDPSTDVIVMYLESFGNPRKFARIARRIGRKKPIVALKSGRSLAGSRAASSHTGALASVDAAVDALSAQTGMIRVDTIQELFGVASLLANQPLPRGRRVGVLTNAGGPGILAADALEASGLELPVFSPELQARLAKGLPAEASVSNPVDLIASAGPDSYAHVAGILAESDEIDALITINIQTMEGAPDIGAPLLAAWATSDKTHLAVLMESGSGRITMRNERMTVPVYDFPEDAAKALARVAEYAEWRSTPSGSVPVFDDVNSGLAREAVASALDRMGEDGGWLGDDEVRTVLGAFGISTPRSFSAATAAEAVEAWSAIGGPVAMKLVAPSALHKTDIGGVVLNVVGADEVARVFADLVALASDAKGVLVQEMIPKGHETLIGMTEDPSFGPLLVFGMGGIYVELLKDVVVRVAPITDTEAKQMVFGIKSAKLLQGYRGQPAGDIEAAELALLRVSALLEAVPELAEMDLNPVIVLPPGEGVMVVDARIRVRPVRSGWSPEVADLPSVAD